MKTSTQFSFFLFLYCFVLSTLTAQPTIHLKEIAKDFNNPVDITHAGDDRLFIVEQQGVIKIYSKEQSTLDAPFLDIQDRVRSGGERGLLGLAFHPNYKENGFFFVNYTATNGGQTRIARFTVSADDPNKADPNSEVILLTINQPFSNHNGGGIKFGGDGYLYIGMGDGGSGGDPLDSGQTPNSLLGKMLRIDVDNGSPYGIPADNPFINDSTISDEIWAIGLRNPWRFSFDRATQDLWIGDVGQNAWEEVSYQPANSKGGENYGWRCYEGFETFNTTNCAADSTMTPPVHVYRTGSVDGASITGGFVYRGSQNPSLLGHYLYGDYVSRKIWSLIPNDSGDWTNVELLNSGFLISTFGEDQAGELYVADHRGGIYQIMDDQTSPVQTISTIEELMITPNPFQDKMLLQMETTSAEAIQIKIFAANGQLIYQELLNGVGTITKIIGLEKYAKGFYYLQLSQGKERMIRKIVKN